MALSLEDIILEANSIILSGGRRTTASNMRKLVSDAFGSFPNIIDGGNIFQSLVGYSSELTLTDRKNFAYKGWVEDYVDSQIVADLSAYFKKDGTIAATGSFNLAGFNLDNVDVINGQHSNYLSLDVGATLYAPEDIYIQSGKDINVIANGTGDLNLSSNNNIFGTAPYVEFTGTSGWFGTAGPSYLNGLSFDDTTGIKIQSASDTIIYGYGTDSNLTLRNTSASLDVTGTLNLGGLNATTINIGSPTASVINIIGSTLFANVTNFQTADKLITISKGAGAATASGAGFEIEENSIITGYLKTTTGRDGFLFKAPANTADSSFIFSATSARSYTYQDRSYTVAGLDDINSTNIISGLGFTPENISNKATDFSTLNDTLYPSNNAVNNLYTLGGFYKPLFWDDFLIQHPCTSWVLLNNASGGVHSNAGGNEDIGEFGLANIGTNTNAIGGRGAKNTITGIVLGRFAFDIYIKIKIPTLSVSTAEFNIVCGLTDVISDLSSVASNGIWALYKRSAYGNYYNSVTSASGVQTVKTCDGTSGNPTISVNANDQAIIKISVNAAGTQVTFSIATRTQGSTSNFSFVAIPAHTTNIPTGVIYPTIYILGEAGTTNRIFYSDLFGIVPTLVSRAF